LHHTSLPCEILLLINDTPQRSVATWFRCGGTFDYYFTTDLLLSLFWKNFWNSSTFGKVVGKSWLPQVPCVPRYCHTKRWRTRLISDVWRAGTLCNIITLWLVLFTNFESMMREYQNDAVSTTCYSPTDVISDWTLTVCTGVFVTSILLMHIQSSSSVFQCSLNESQWMCFCHWTKWC